MGPSRRYWLTVLLLDAQGRRLIESEPITFGTGPGPVWHAQAIWSAEDEKNPSGSQGNAKGWALMRGVVRLPPGPILWASLYATADSTVPARQFVYRLWLNGRFLGCGPVFPLDGEDRYRGYEVTDLLRPGAQNVLGVVAYAMEGRRFQAQLDVGRPDGRVEHYGTDAEWKAISGAKAFPDSASIGTTYYQAPAEDIDVSRYPRGFSKPGFDDSDWPKVRIRPSFSKCLAAPADGTRLTRVDVHRVLKTAPGHLLLDFGSVRLGGIGLRVDLSQHLDLIVRYGEVLDGRGGVRYRLATSNVYQDRWRLQPGRNRAQTWGIR
ncbi:MAG: alpha-L-rhamnosidase N-terminal domain-containing protein, partial [Bifidobacterium sp.]|nr:alpha-L-rhamnosidase N-terminal domain-containing protein [Bifidobacterium sp.]